MIITGKALVMGDDVNTDIIISGRYLSLPVEKAVQHVFESMDPEFKNRIKPGCIIVAGKNFGCGSSREIASQVLKQIGISCILAKSYARIFYRNTIAIGLPALIVKDLPANKSKIGKMSICLDSGKISCLKTKIIFKATPLHPKIRELISKGGVDGVLKDLKKNRNQICSKQKI